MEYLDFLHSHVQKLMKSNNLWQSFRILWKEESADEIRVKLLSLIWHSHSKSDFFQRVMKHLQKI